MTVIVQEVLEKVVTQIPKYKDEILQNSLFPEFKRIINDNIKFPLERDDRKALEYLASVQGLYSDSAQLVELVDSVSKRVTRYDFDYQIQLLLNFIGS